MSSINWLYIASFADKSLVVKEVISVVVVEVIGVVAAEGLKLDNLDRIEVSSIEGESRERWYTISCESLRNSYILLAKA